MMAEKSGSFMAAMKDFFGFGVMPDGKPQTLSEFAKECKELSPADREYFSVGLRENGYPIPPVA
jgi:hypothetical protein